MHRSSTPCDCRARGAGLIFIRLRACAAAGVPDLEVMDTSELDTLVELSVKERERVTELRTVAKAQQRKVLRVNCDLDIKAIERLHGFIDHVKKDKRRQW